MAAAGLHFGIPAWGIEAEPGWGVRRNSTGTTSSDTLRFLDEIAVDIAPGSGSVEWGSRPDNEKFHWLVFDPGDDSFGVGREPARRQDLPDDVDPQPPPPPPPDVGPKPGIGMDDHAGFVHRWGNDAIRTHSNLGAGETGRTQIYQEIQERHRETHEGADDPVAVRAVWHRLLTDWYHYPTVAQASYEWDLPDVDLPPPPPPLPPERNILEFARGDLVGHFLAGPLYFAPSYSIRNEIQFRVACQWFKDNNYNCAVWMTEQAHWGEQAGRDPAWTDPGQDGAPLIYIAPGGLRVFGWPLEEQLRRIRIMRAEYGLHVVASLWEQARVEHHFDFAIANTPRIVEALDADVIAWLNTWEQDEVLTSQQERQLNNAVGAAAIKSSGPHWAHGIPDADYWDGDRSHVFWHQYDRGGDLSAQARESVRICRESNRVSIGYEHSGMLPSRHRPVHTLEECRQRGRNVVANGEHLSLTG